MDFADPGLEDQFNSNLHPDTRTVCLELEVWSDEQGLPPPCITSIGRSDDAGERIYYPLGLEMLRKFQANLPQTERDRQTARILLAMDDAGRRAWARAKFSWHKVNCAVNLRTRQYSEDQRILVMGWLGKRCASGPWELVTEDHGTGPHYHLGRRDFVWRANYTKKVT